MWFKATRRRGATPRTAESDQPKRWPGWKFCLRWAGVALALTGLGFGLQALSQHFLDPTSFPLRHVRLSGELRNLETNDMRALVQHNLGQNFFALNIDAIHTEISAHPWIDYVSVHRRWPDTLEIRFRERTAFGYWGEDEMIDVNGRRFRPGKRPPKLGLWPQLAGPDGNEQEVLKTYRETSAKLKAIGLQVTELVQDERRAWSLTFANGLEVSLGRNQFSSRLQRFIDIYPRIPADQLERIAAMDLRYVNGFAVRWSNPSETDQKQRVSNAKTSAPHRKQLGSAG